MKNSYMASRVKNLRLQKGYSQESLAEQTHLSLRTIQRIESGDTIPHGDTLQRLAKCLDVDLAALTEISAANLPQDMQYLTLIHLSALSFLIFPLFGVLAPYVLWIIKRNQIQNIDATAKRVINFQITCCILIVAGYFLIMSGFAFMKVFLASLFLYAYNIIVIILNSMNRPEIS